MGGKHSNKYLLSSFFFLFSFAFLWGRRREGERTTEKRGEEANGEFGGVGEAEGFGIIWRFFLFFFFFFFFYLIDLFVCLVIVFVVFIDLISYYQSNLTK